jgi:hypothetical protein
MADIGVDSTNELAAIFLQKARKRGLDVSGHGEAALPGLLDAHFPAKIRALWNAGLADRLLSESVQCLNARLDPCSATREQLSTLELSDVGAAGTFSSRDISACFIRATLIRVEGFRIEGLASLFIHGLE